MTAALPAPRDGVRPGIRWLLGLTTCACAWALWWPGTDPAPALVPAQEAAVPAADGTADAWRALPRLPERLARGGWPAAADFDPFAGVPAPPPRVLPAPVALAAVVPPPPPAPRPEPRFVGRVVSPDGQDVVYLAWRDQTVSAAVGQPAGEGYLLEAIGPDVVVLRHPGDGARVRIAIPAFERTGGTP